GPKKWYPSWPIPTGGRQRLAAVAILPGWGWLRWARWRLGLGYRRLRFQGCQDLTRKEQELVRVELLGLAAVALAQELLELVLELLDQMVLEAQRLDELADQLVGRVQIGGEFAPGGRHTLEYGNDRRERQEILNESCEFVSCFC